MNHKLWFIQSFSIKKRLLISTFRVLMNRFYVSPNQHKYKYNSCSIITTTATTSAPVATVTSTKITPSSLSLHRLHKRINQVLHNKHHRIHPKASSQLDVRSNFTTQFGLNNSVTTGNVDDYFMADEDEEEETEKKKKEESENNPDRTFEGDKLEDEEEYRL